MNRRIIDHRSDLNIDDERYEYWFDAAETQSNHSVSPSFNVTAWTNDP